MASRKGSGGGGSRRGSGSGKKKEPPIRITPVSGGSGDKKWRTKQDGAKRALGYFPTQEEAEDRGRSVAKSEETELVTHGRHGRIRSKDSFGNDPHPPKDKEH